MALCYYIRLDLHSIYGTDSGCLDDCIETSVTFEL